jgi:hypothetical protein
VPASSGSKIHNVRNQLEAGNKQSFDFQGTKRRYNPEGVTFHNLKSYTYKPFLLSTAI